MEKPEDPCPECSTTRDVRFIDMKDKNGKPSETRRAFECEGCEIARPCCPKCGSVRIGRVCDDQKRMVCARCGTEFPDPEIQDSESKTKLTDSEIDFLVDLAGRFSGNLRGLQSWVEFQESECRRLERPVERSKIDYVEHHVRLYLVVRRIIAIRRTSQQAEEGIAAVPSANVIAETLLCHNHYVGPLTKEIRLSKAEALRGILANLLPSGPNLFQREGKRWRIRFEGKEIELVEMLGLDDIAKLLAKPGERIDAFDLTIDPAASAIDAGTQADLFEAGVPVTRGLWQTIEDEPERSATLKEYRALWKANKAEQAQANEFRDYDRLAELERLEDLLNREISRLSKIGGRPRPTDEAERARLNVQRRIKRAIGAIEKKCENLAKHLSRQIVTGRRCCYMPDPDHPVDWEL